MDNIQINELKIENVKRVKAFSLKPNENGLTIVGGGYRQGKTSVLDAIAWALGGDKYRPSMPHHKGVETPPYLRVELSNGLIIERKGTSFLPGCSGRACFCYGTIVGIAWQLGKNIPRMDTEQKIRIQLRWRCLISGI